MRFLVAFGFLWVVAISGVVCFFCGGALLSRNDRISRREFEAWRFIPFLILLGLSASALLLARRSELVCERSGAVVQCSHEQRRVGRSFHRLLPPGSVRGAEVEVTMGRDHDGYPERQTRLVVLAGDERILVTDYGQGDGDRFRADLLRFLADPSQRSITIGQDNRWYFYPTVPMWLLMALFALIGRL